MVPDTIIQHVSITGEGNIVVGKGDVIVNPLPPAEARLRHDLGILLKNVQSTWIEGVLEKSIHEVALLDLGMEMRDAAVDNPWQMIIEGPDQVRQPVPRGRKIKDVFEEANRFLLILGAPGSGKTTTLLQLARDLIAEIDPAFTRPIPVILNLSTWINRQQALDDWLIAELTTRYRVSSKAGRRWLRQRRLLPLLDGLDEVKLENRTACVQKINQLVADYGLHGAVVCSRYQDYNKLSIKLAFNRATYIQELTKEQVDEFLNQAGDKLASLREALRHDGALHSLAQSPLILNIMSLAYQNARAEDLADPNLNTDDARRRHLFDSYIQRMLQRKRGLQSYETHQTTKSMSWLARNMQRHNQEVFLFEGLQPSWLPSRSWQQIYFVVSGLISGLIVGLVFGFGWRLAASLGVLVGLTDLLRAEWLREPARAKRLPMFWWSILNITVTTLTVGLLLRPASLLITDQAFDWILVIGLGLLLGARGSRKNSVNYIQTGEALYWSSRKALRGGILGGLGMGMFGAIVGIIFFDRTVHFGPFTVDMRLGQEEGVLLLGSLGTVLGGLVGAITAGINRTIIETKSFPNQGIKLSIRSALLVGLSFVIVSSLIVFLIVFYFGLQLTSASEATAAAFSVLELAIRPIWFLGGIGFLWYGGFDVLQHYFLRLILMVLGCVSSDYARFLDHAVDRILLQQVGGGYRFIHRFLLEHFARMDTTGE